MSRAGTPLHVRAAVADRRRRAFELFITGVPPVTIGRMLARPDTPCGYDGTATDVQIAAVVRSDLTRVQRQVTAENGEAVRAWAARRATETVANVLAESQVPGKMRNPKAQLRALAHVVDGLLAEQRELAGRIDALERDRASS